MKTIYIAGPMAGIKDFNFPAFYAAEANLRADGFDPVNPARLDEEYAPPEYQPQLYEDFQIGAKLRAQFMRRDLPLVCECDGIALLLGWEDSVGANLELLVARATDSFILLEGQSGKFYEPKRTVQPMLGLVWDHLHHVAGSVPTW